MKKRNKKAIIITAIVMFIGILMVLAGIFGGRIVSLFKQDFDYKNIKPEDLGKTITTDIQVYYEDIDLPDKALQVLGNLNNDDAAMIVIDISALSKNDKDIYYSKSLQYITVTGSVRALSDEEYKEVSDSLFRFYEEVYYKRLERQGLEDTPENREGFTGIIMDIVIPYCFEVRSIKVFNWVPFIPAGILIFVVALVLEICLVFKLKKRIVLPIVYALMVISTFRM